MTSSSLPRITSKDKGFDKKFYPQMKMAGP